MMKRFFTSMLGALAAIWISVSLLAILGFIGIVALVSVAMKESQPKKVTENSILYINLDTDLEEINPALDMASVLYGKDGNVTLLQPAIEAIKKAEKDRRIRGIYIYGGAISAGTASLKSFRDALEHFKETSGKWVIAYGDELTQASYYFCAGADELYLNPEGMVDLHGLSSSIMFYKNLLEKIGVNVQVVKVGTFKSAVEPFILDSISPANRLQVSQYIGTIWNNLATTIADERGMTLQRVNELADSMLLTLPASELVNLGVVDQTLYRHQVEDLLRERVGVERDDDLPLIAITDYYADIKESIFNKSRNKIAVLYAVGAISEDGNEGITSSALVPRILELAENDEVRGMVLRVNSPGGSAYASEQIWEALDQFKKTGKKLYVSMGDYAASGGYYISCGAEKIYASPVTLTGSIGIYGLIPEGKELLKKIGINFSYVNTNANGDFPNLTSPMTEFQKASMQNRVNRGYETFVGRVAEGRHLSVDSVKAIAEGRVWAGATAHEIGLVDELGSLDETIEALAAECGLSHYELDIYPRMNPSFWETFTSMTGSVSETVLRKAMGEQGYEIFRKARRIEELQGIQCIMPDELEF